MRAIFIDTSYFIALVNRQDAYHHLAKEWARKLVKEHILCHTSIPILFEIADGFARLGRRQIGISLVENIVNSENTVLHAFSEVTYHNARNLYISRSDKEWGLTDCYSFELMKELQLTQVLTADKHFEQFGYEILLK
jgi:predicted nucleic acid-binding protein